MKVGPKTSLHLVLPHRYERGVYGLDSDARDNQGDEDQLAVYCRRTRRSGIPDWSVDVAFSPRIAAIAPRIMGRVIASTANISQHAGSVAGGPGSEPTSPDAWWTRSGRSR